MDSGAYSLQTSFLSPFPSFFFPYPFEHHNLLTMKGHLQRGGEGGSFKEEMEGSEVGGGGGKERGDWGERRERREIMTRLVFLFCNGYFLF